MGIKEDLTAIVGPENFSDEPEELKSYAKDSSVSLASMPAYVVKPENADEVQKIVKLSNQNKTPIVPCSSGIHFHGNTIPGQGGIVLDLRRMDRVLNVDERNRAVRFEPGVTWGQLKEELDKHDLIPLNPLLPHPLKSALSSQLEREPILATKFEYSEPLLTMEVVLPTGDLFRTGSASVPGFPGKSASAGVYPEGPGMDWYRLFLGAQGTMGVATWVNSKVECKPKADKTFFIPFDTIEDAIAPMYRIQRRMIGQECLLLNNINLATILAEKWPGDFETLKKVLPRWTLILVVSGGWRRPDEKIAYEEAALREIGQELSITAPQTSIPGVPGKGKEISQVLRSPWPEGKTYWKFARKGACQDLFFFTVMSRAPTFTKAIGEVLTKHGLSLDDVGIYVQPVERGRVCHFECNIFYQPDDINEVARVRELYITAAEVLIDMGALFTRPYGSISNIVYDRAATYTTALKKMKNLLDPNEIMAPGRLCF
jgi:FAD/FMN-containing dehydrogenase